MILMKISEEACFFPLQPDQFQVLPVVEDQVLILVLLDDPLQLSNLHFTTFLFQFSYLRSPICEWLDYGGNPTTYVSISILLLEKSDLRVSHTLEE
ncbi:MAG: hypothetical protein ACFFD4_09485 [Candidatus Odinarchaeota archaeon]